MGTNTRPRRSEMKGEVFSVHEHQCDDFKRWCLRSWVCCQRSDGISPQLHQRPAEKFTRIRGSQQTRRAGGDIPGLSQVFFSGNSFPGVLPSLRLESRCRAVKSVFVKLLGVREATDSSRFCWFVPVSPAACCGLSAAAGRARA